MGRWKKSGREKIVALVVGLDDWFTMNHEDRIMEYDRRITVNEKAAQGLAGVSSDVYWSGDSFCGYFLTMKIKPDKLGEDERRIKTEMFEGRPSVMVQAPDPDTLRIFVYTLDEGDDERIAGRLNEVLSS